MGVRENFFSALSTVDFSLFSFFFRREIGVLSAVFLLLLLSSHSYLHAHLGEAVRALLTRLSLPRVAARGEAAGEREGKSCRRRCSASVFSEKGREPSSLSFSLFSLSLRSSLLCVMFADNIEVEAAYEEDAEISQVREGEEEKKEVVDV